MAATSGTGVLVHEWLSRDGGSERVFDTLADVWPDADLACLWSDVPDRYHGRPLRESWLAGSRLRQSKALALPFMLRLWRHWEGAYDWAVVSSHLFAHHVRFDRSPEDFTKLVYVHSPARYIWVPDLDTRGANPAIRAITPPLKAIDRRRAQEATAFAANSQYIADRIRDCWDRDADVIHPPVEVEAIQAVLADPAGPSGDDARVLESLPSQFVLGASRLIPYKRLDLVIRAAERAGLPAVIAGSGPELEFLQSVAAQVSVPVIFVPRPSDELLARIYERAAVFVFPPIEDFGIMPVEALAAGCPIVVAPEGGAREIVGDHPVGAIADTTEPDDLARAIAIAVQADADACRARAADFARDTFMSAIADWAAPHIGSATGPDTGGNR